MNHGSLFSGIGGFDLAAEWMGWENIFHCEYDKESQKVLNKRFPNTLTYGDIKRTDFTNHRGQVDILSGGFPCQPYSSAGRRKGTEDDRHLWPEMLRAIREIQPCYVVGENVRGLTNWNGGLVFDEVQANLEAEGYEVLPFLLPACGADALSERFRIWFIAYSDRNRLHTNKVQAKQHFKDRIRVNQEQFEHLAIEERGGVPNSRPNGGNNGLPNGVDEYRLKQLGNSVDPYVVLELFKVIQIMLTT